MRNRNLKLDVNFVNPQLGEDEPSKKEKLLQEISIRKRKESLKPLLGIYNELEQRKSHLSKAISSLELRHRVEAQDSREAELEGLRTKREADLLLEELTAQVADLSAEVDRTREESLSFQEDTQAAIERLGQVEEALFALRGEGKELDRKSDFLIKNYQLICEEHAEFINLLNRRRFEVAKLRQQVSRGSRNEHARNNCAMANHETLLLTQRENKQLAKNIVQESNRIKELQLQIQERSQALSALQEQLAYLEQKQRPSPEEVQVLSGLKTHILELKMVRRGKEKELAFSGKKTQFRVQEIQLLEEALAKAKHEEQACMAEIESTVEELRRLDDLVTSEEIEISRGIQRLESMGVERSVLHQIKSHRLRLSQARPRQ